MITPSPSSFNKPIYTPTDTSMEQVILEPYEYLKRMPGNDFPSLLVQAFNQWLKIPNDKLRTITEILTMMNTSALMMDDIEDNSDLRSGQPGAHKVYGIPITINTACYVYSLVLGKLATLENHDANKAFSTELINLHRGQGIDLYWRETLTVPSEHEYLEMSSLKTGGMFRMGVQMMQAFSEDQNIEKYNKLVNLLGLYFQLHGDYMNLCSDQFTEEKGFCEDLTEGKLSFLIIHAMRTDSFVCNQLKNILRQRTKDRKIKEYAISLLRGPKTFEYTLNALSDLENDIRQEIDTLGGNAFLSKLLDKFCASIAKTLRHQDKVDKVDQQQQ